MVSDGADVSREKTLPAILFWTTRSTGPAPSAAADPCRCFGRVAACPVLIPYWTQAQVPGPHRHAGGAKPGRGEAHTATAAKALRRHGSRTEGDHWTPRWPLWPAWHPAGSCSLATLTHPSDGDWVRGEATTIAAPPGPAVDVTSAPHSRTRTRVGVSDRRTQELPLPDPTWRVISAQVMCGYSPEATQTGKKNQKNASAGWWRSVC
jgi:hypothetical protein